MRIVITADLNAQVTGREAIRRMVAGISHTQPDLVVVGGNIGCPSRLFEDCLSLFLVLDRPVLVVSGRRDLWCSPLEDSDSLYRKVLPAIVRDMGYHWLDGEEPFLAGNVGIAGSIGWYDEHLENGDGEQPGRENLMLREERLNWGTTDEAFAGECADRLGRQLQRLESDTAVDRVLVVTHFPLFESQLDRNLDEVPSGELIGWHGALGRQIRDCAKLRWVVSGCLQQEVHGVVERADLPPVATAVVGSKYFKPRYLILDTE